MPGCQCNHGSGAEAVDQADLRSRLTANRYPGYRTALRMDAFIYQYSVGGLIFVIGLVYAGKQGYIGLSGGRLRNLLLLVGGLLVFMALQGYLQYSSMETTEPVEYQGGAERKDTLGQPIDYGIMVAYFLAILAVGIYFGRRQKTIKDFFFGGQRFSWWLVAFSMMATLVGSYRFVKYSRVAYEYGLSSSQTYLNDWFLMPLLIFGWLPIFYFSRITSVPEYFQRRFGPSVRLCATILILLYLIGYVGVNLYTMGTAFNILLGWKVLGHEERLDARIVNYADDFVICCRGTAQEAMVAMRVMMQKLKLTVNETKTHVCRLPDESFDLVGYTIGRCYSPRLFSGICG